MQRHCNIEKNRLEYVVRLWTYERESMRVVSCQPRGLASYMEYHFSRCGIMYSNSTSFSELKALFVDQDYCQRKPQAVITGARGAESVVSYSSTKGVPLIIVYTSLGSVKAEDYTNLLSSTESRVQVVFKNLEPIKEIELILASINSLSKG